MTAMTEEAERRRRVRRSAWLLAGFALVIYVGFIIAYVNRGA